MSISINAKNRKKLTQIGGKKCKSTYHPNPEWPFPPPPADFKEKYPHVEYGSPEHDRLAHAYVKGKHSITKKADFPLYFPRYTTVLKTKRTTEPYVRRKPAAFLARTTQVQF